MGYLCAEFFFYCFTIQAIQQDLADNQHLVTEVDHLAQHFEPEAGQRADEVGRQWTSLETSLERLSDCYDQAAADWVSVENNLDDIRQWCADKLEWSHQRTVQPGEEAETLAEIQVIAKGNETASPWTRSVIK